MSTTDIGRQAETAAAEYLTRHGYRVLEQNWRTRYCEIDIVAQKGSCLHFVEVKYRTHDTQGSGLEYITPRKLRRMRFAADMYATEHRWQGDINVAGIEVTSPDNTVAEFIESISLDG